MTLDAHNTQYALRNTDCISLLWHAAISMVYFTCVYRLIPVRKSKEVGMKKIIIALFVVSFVMASASAYAGESFFQSLADAIHGKSATKYECVCKVCNCSPCKCEKK